MEHSQTSKERQIARRVLQQLEEKGLLGREMVTALLAEAVQWLLNHDPTVRGQLQEILRRYQEEEGEDSGPIN